MRPRWHRGSGAPLPGRRCRIVATGGQRDGRQRVGADRSARLGGARGSVSLLRARRSSKNSSHTSKGDPTSIGSNDVGAVAVSPTVFFRHVVHEVVRMSAYLVSGSAAAVWPMACWQSLLAEQPIGPRGICAATKNQRPRRLSYGQQRGYVVAIMHKRKAYPGSRSSLADSGSSTFSARSMRARPHSSGCRCPPAIFPCRPRSPCGAPPTYAARGARNGDNG